MSEFKLKVYGIIIGVMFVFFFFWELFCGIGRHIFVREDDEE